MPRSNRQWTPEDDATIESLLRAGHSSYVVATALGITRSAVTGRIWRNPLLRALWHDNHNNKRRKRLAAPRPVAVQEDSGPDPMSDAPPPRRHPTVRKKPTKVATNIPPIIPPSLEGPLPPPFFKPAPDPEPIEPPTPAADPRGPILMELRTGQCKFPVLESADAVGKYFFCGAPCRPDMVYCRRHHDLTSNGLRYNKTAA
jgi:hypothetical protein